MVNTLENTNTSWIVPFEEHIRKITFSRLRLAGLVIMFVAVADGATAFATQPDLFWQTFWARVIVGFTGGAIFAATFSALSKLQLTLLSFVLILVLSLDIENAILASGGVQSRYYVGFVLLLAGVGLFLPLNVWQMTQITALVWTVYLAPLALVTSETDMTVFVNNMLFMVVATLIALVSSKVTSSLRRSEFRNKISLQEEQERSERLLLNILPPQIAERLKKNHDIIADGYEEATIMFGDIVGFTPLAATMTPEKLVQLLNTLFSRFDDLTETYAVEKIKTIGDAYMVAGGLCEGEGNHAVAVADMALEMLQVVKDVNRDESLQLNIRIGINTGPVVAGVIGKKKFIYDLWGDAVNTASRMESTGLAGQIQVSERTYQLLAHRYTFESRGKIQVKGKGVIPTYILRGRNHENS